jgi:hypothetical protein
MTKSLIDAVREILLSDWDPILIGDNPNLFDEYDSYVYEVVSYLKSGNANADGVYHLLWRAEEEKIGMSVDDDVRSSVAKKLMTLMMSE